MRSHFYRTRQRENILKCLQLNYDRHLTADEIYGILRSGDIPVGKATVYRNLDRLVNDGEVRRLMADGDSGARYQLNSCEKGGCAGHFHIKCNVCGRLEHLDCERVKRFFGHIKKDHGFEVDICRTVFYGVCSDCLKNGKG